MVVEAGYLDGGEATRPSGKSGMRGGGRRKRTLRKGAKKRATRRGKTFLSRKSK